MASPVCGVVRVAGVHLKGLLKAGSEYDRARDLGRPNLSANHKNGTFE